DLTLLHPRTRQMVTSAAGVQWTVVSTEVEALQLEYTWIKKYDPRFNVRYRDDKTYPLLAVTVGEEIPRAFVYRGPRRRGTRYFGPYSRAWAIRDTLDTLQRVFPVRSCSAGVYKRQAQLGRPCLLGYIDKCAAPCIGRVTPDEHRVIVDELCDFLAGRTDAIMRRIEKQMISASADLASERASRRRDELGARRRATAKPAVVLATGPTPTSWAWRPTSSRCPFRCSTSGADGSAGSGAGWWSTRTAWGRTVASIRRSPSPASCRTTSPSSMAGRRSSPERPTRAPIWPPRSPGRSSCRHYRRTRPSWPTGSPPCADHGCSSGSRNAATSARSPRPSTATPWRR